MKGFTLIELLVTIAISGLLVVVAIPIYGNLQVSAQLREESSLIVQAIRSTREQSVAGYNNAAHGVYFHIDPAGPDSYTTYEGASYLGRIISGDRTKTIHSTLSFQNSSFTLSEGDIDINFSKSVGEPNNIGTLILHHSVSGQRNIILNSLGAVSEN
jgi:prepilin-type N-terminal cleavage/methylation domain-containing protein